MPVKHIADTGKMVKKFAAKPLVVQKTRNISHYTKQKSGIYVPEIRFGNIKPFSKESILLGIQRRRQFIGECCELRKDGKVLVRSCRLVD